MRDRRRQNPHRAPDVVADRRPLHDHYTMRRQGALLLLLLRGGAGKRTDKHCKVGTSEARTDCLPSHRPRLPADDRIRTELPMSSQTGGPCMH